MSMLYIFVHVFNVYVYMCMLRVLPVPRLVFMDGILISYLILIQSNCTGKYVCIDFVWDENKYIWLIDLFIYQWTLSLIQFI